VSLIAEAKRASPSRGLLCPDYRPGALALAYARNGAAAISVLTDSRYFQGDLTHVSVVRAALDDANLDVPVLRKDFLFDAYHIYETRASGADALLLIAAVLSDSTLSELVSLARELGMTALVEVHDEFELARALKARPRVVGINNRDLRDFTVDLGTFGRLQPLLPEDVVAVSESGVRTGDDVRRLAQMGADAVLVGEAIVTATSIPAKVRELAGGGHP
jgi:indole-3-glycerol phosphate synthase